MISQHTLKPKNSRHKRWVKGTHWIITVSFLVLAYSGYVILKVHPRLYWGEVGNSLTPALFELPISRNYQHGGWKNNTPFFDDKDSPVSMSRNFAMWNKNSWARSLHFLAAWFLVLTGAVYLVTGIFTGHFRNHLWPRVSEFRLRLFWRDLIKHLRMQIPSATNDSQYGLLQKCTYSVVIFFLLPVTVLTGLTMSPAVTAAYPFLLKMFFGAQSARTIHFFASAILVFFLIVHVVMVIKSGFKKQMRAMTIGK